MPAMIAFTSAKSRLMMPGMVMMSEMPCTPWRRMSSAMRNDSKKPAFCATASSFSLGMAIIVSTDSSSSFRPRSACVMRRLPSKLNGLVMTPTVSAPISDASDAMIGAAPVPVPPPMPAVTNTRSAPSSASMILSASSSAALRPVSGLAPAPSPFVSFTPSCIFSGARDICSACRSVLATTNSTPSTPASIMRFTALPPPPPTPMTLILALLPGSSWNWMRMSSLFFFESVMRGSGGSCRRSLVVGRRSQRSRLSALGSRLSALGSRLSALGSRLSARDYFDFDFLISTFFRLSASLCVLSVLCVEVLRFPREERLQLRPDSLLLRAPRHPRALRVRRHAEHGGVLRLGQRFRHASQRGRRRQARRLAQHVFRNLGHRIQPRAAAGEHQTRTAQLEDAGMAQVVAQHLEQLAGARLQHLAQQALRHQPRRTITHRGHFNLVGFRDARHHGATEHALDLFRVNERRAQPDGHIAGEVVAADGNHRRVHHHAVVADDHVGRTCANIGQANAQLALIGAQHGFRRRQRLKNSVVH